MAKKAMVVNKVLAPSQVEFETMQAIARNAAASGLYAGVGSEQKILMILLAARELGIGPMTALNGGIWNIQGKIELSARLMASMIRKAGHSITVKMINDTECIVEGRRTDNGDSGSASFSMQEAQRAGLLRPGGNWAKYPQDMLYARALSRLARRLFPDIINNAYIEGEIQEASGAIIKTETIEESILTEEEIQEYLESFGDDREYMTKFLEVVCQLRNWNASKAIQEFNKDSEATRKKFENWKSKQKTLKIEMDS